MHALHTSPGMFVTDSYRNESVMIQAEVVDEGQRVDTPQLQQNISEETMHPCTWIGRSCECLWSQRPLLIRSLATVTKTPDSGLTHSAHTYATHTQMHTLTGHFTRGCLCTDSYRNESVMIQAEVVVRGAASVTLHSCSRTSAKRPCTRALE